MSNPHLIRRGQSIRAWLLDQARHCQATGTPFPTRHELADASGICAEQVRRHRAELIKTGQIIISRVRHRRIRIEDVRA
jgi:hypothetical protein